MFLECLRGYAMFCGKFSVKMAHNVVLMLQVFPNYFEQFLSILAAFLTAWMWYSQGNTSFYAIDNRGNILLNENCKSILFCLISFSVAAI